MRRGLVVFGLFVLSYFIMLLTSELLFLTIALIVVLFVVHKRKEIAVKYQPYAYAGTLVFRLYIFITVFAYLFVNGQQPVFDEIIIVYKVIVSFILLMYSSSYHYEFYTFNYREDADWKLYLASLNVERFAFINMSVLLIYLLVAAFD